MAHYRCYFLGADGKITAAEDIDAGTESEALATCRELAARSGAAALELWQCQRRLHKETSLARRPSSFLALLAAALGCLTPAASGWPLV